MTFLDFVRSVFGDDSPPEPPIRHCCVQCGVTYAVDHAMCEACGGAIREEVGYD